MAENIRRTLDPRQAFARSSRGHWPIPPDALERARNDLIDGDYQHNRNPFIDHPEWVCSIWGSSVPAPTCATPPNVAPTTSAMTGTTPEDTATTVALTATDPDGDTLTWSLDAAQPAAHGTAGVTGSTLSYTPAANYNGPDEIGVIVSDGRGGSASTTVTITVSPVNDAPVATAASVTTAEDTAQVITLAGTDADGDGLTYAIATQPAHGTVNLTGNQATYTPRELHGPDSVTFTVNDGNRELASGHRLDRRDGRQRGSRRQPGVGHDGRGHRQGDHLGGHRRRRQPPDLRDRHATCPRHRGPRRRNQATYTPAANYNGPDSFTFTVHDGTVSAPARPTVSIAVTAVNDAPVANRQRPKYDGRGHRAN